jgi:hypothetical protein
LRRLQILNDLLQGREAGSQAFDLPVPGVEFLLMLQVKLDDRLLEKLDIALQATGAPLHRFFDGADFDAGNILRMGDGGAQHARRQHRDAEKEPAAH